MRKFLAEYSESNMYQGRTFNSTPSMNTAVDNKRVALINRVHGALSDRYEDLIENDVVGAAQIASFVNWPVYSKDRDGIRGDDK